MQDPSFFPQMNPIFPEQEHLKCPRCESTNTKFCYYNNYNLSQPRHFCKSCKRYWTKGGALRNIPVGGASRKNTKRSSDSKKISSLSSSSSSAATVAEAAAKAASAASSSTISSTSSAAATASSSSKSALDKMSGNINSLLGSSNRGQFGNLIYGSVQNGSNLGLGEFGSIHNPGSGQDPIVDLQVGVQSVDGVDNSSRWNDGNGWPGLAVFTPASSYQ